jgi:hypothetical protein
VIKTPLEVAESKVRSISVTEKNGQFAAIRQVLLDRERKLRAVQTAQRLYDGVRPDNGE